MTPEEQEWYNRLTKVADAASDLLKHGGFSTTRTTNGTYVKMFIIDPVSSYEPAEQLWHALADVGLRPKD